MSFSPDEGRETGGPMTTPGLMVVMAHFGFCSSRNFHTAWSAAVLEAPYRTPEDDSRPSWRSSWALARKAEAWSDSVKV